MWDGNKGPCSCFFCVEKREHPDATHATLLTPVDRGHLQVAESLDPRDTIHTKMCPVCTHEWKGQ